jgi:hypothetical protein
MNVLFEFPLGFAAMATVPALLAIYLLRNRFHRVTVSSLMLWDRQQRHKQGGLNLDRLQTPLLFLIELLVFLLLALAAAGPLLRSKSDTRKVVIVLDNSFSMLAQSEGGQSTRNQSIHELKRYLKKSSPFRASFIQAGTAPKVLARDIDNIPEAVSMFDHWQCLSSAADLDAATVLAGEIGGQQARILVISDHFPDETAADSRFEYWSLGRPLANVGFLHAERSRIDNRDKCMFSIGNFSKTEKTVTLAITSLDGKTQVYQESIDIDPDEPFRLMLQVPRHLDIVASIDDDAMAIDNRVTLLNLDDKPVRISVDLESEPLAETISKILDLLPEAREVKQAAHVRITDKALPPDPVLQSWTLHIQSDPNAAAFVGPFVVDRSHPLTDGLDLQGVIWAASGSLSYQALPVIAAGNTALLQVQPDDAAGEYITLYLNPEMSTLTRSPNWPILFWNLVHWRRQSLPGLERANYRLGAQVAFEPPKNVTDVQLTGPDGNSDVFTNPGGPVIIEAAQTGVYELAAGDNQYAFAVNALAADESDLRDCRTRRKINPQQTAQFWWEYRSYNWLLLLIAAGLLALHAWLIFRQTNRRTA